MQGGAAEIAGIGRTKGQFATLDEITLVVRRFADFGFQRFRGIRVAWVGRIGDFDGGGIKGVEVVQIALIVRPQSGTGFDDQAAFSRLRQGFGNDGAGDPSAHDHHVVLVFFCLFRSDDIHSFTTVEEVTGGSDQAPKPCCLAPCGWAWIASHTKPC
ncbi:hypothetical protein D3C75_798090 [compost metagenome]